MTDTPDEKAEKIIADVYTSMGGPGSFFGIEKLRKALKAEGYKYDESEIRRALKNIWSYEKFVTKYRKIPAHVSKRWTHSSQPYIIWQGDSAVTPKGFGGRQKFFQVWVDCFSRKIFSLPVGSLTAKNSVAVLTSICTRNGDDDDDKYPDTVLTDRGKRRSA